jgi:phosphoglycerate dehydrogenase-like enzyme
MTSAILVHPDFDADWPFAADYAHRIWGERGSVHFQRLEPGDQRTVGEILGDQSGLRRMISFGVPFRAACLARFPKLEEISVRGEGRLDADAKAALQAKSVTIVESVSEGFWGQSVAEFALGLTLGALRRIPQTHHSIITDQAEWDYQPSGGVGRPGQRGYQYGDDSRWTNGTVQGKRVRIVGAGNIGSRYASFISMLGADVAAWDPFASEPCFHRAGARREFHLDQLPLDAEIFAPMLPLTPKTEGLITAELIDSLPVGCLVVLVTRALICDMQAVRRRVLSGELALAADVFDVEPLPLNDPLLNRPNVVHTPHSAGRTRQANEAYAEHFLAQFRPYASS